jgi:DNA-binding IclR family transcriptional regulator
MKDESVPIQSVKISLTIIQELIERDGATGTAIARVLKLPKSTANDHLRTLEELRFVVRTGGEYHVSCRFLQIGSMVRRQMPIYVAAQPELADLAKETGEHVLLMIEEDGLGVILIVEEGENVVNIDSFPGIYLRLHTTAMGKAILAHLPEERVDEIIARYGLPKRTPETTTEYDELREAMEQIRAEGYFVEDSGEIEGIRCMGAPIFGQGKIAGAIGICGPTRRLKGGRLEELQDHLLQKKNVIEINMQQSV